MSKYTNRGPSFRCPVGYGAAGVKPARPRRCCSRPVPLPPRGKASIKGNTVGDADAQDRSRPFPTSAVMNFGHEDTHVHLVDTGLS